MSDKREAIQRAYRWAHAAASHPKNPLVVQLLARQTERAVEGTDSYDVAFAELEQLIARWRAKPLGQGGRAGVDQVLAELLPLLGIEA